MISLELAREFAARGKVEQGAGRGDVLLNHHNAPGTVEHTQGERALLTRDLVVVELHRIDGAAAEFIILGVGAKNGGQKNSRLRALGMRLHCGGSPWRRW